MTIDFKETFISIASKVKDLEKDLMNSTNGNINIESIRSAKFQLDTIVSDLQRLKEETSKLDTSSIHLPYVESLLKQTELLADHLKQILGVKEQGEDAPDLKTLLSREEIAKLLLLVSKAYSVGGITLVQKQNIKDQICAKLGYLRLVLQQKDMKLVFGALAAIGGDE